mmetsp:Transcript_5002/g.14510  ORF Transcript_5002/g.14510 Transcript_5002/m.14510 type:complete len:123 (+) Transcript_5002:495-863(+)
MKNEQQSWSNDADEPARRNRSLPFRFVSQQNQARTYHPIQSNRIESNRIQTANQVERPNRGIIRIGTHNADEKHGVALSYRMCMCSHTERPKPRELLLLWAAEYERTVRLARAGAEAAKMAQ